jgi:hypothetical protein
MKNCEIVVHWGFPPVDLVATTIWNRTVQRYGLSARGQTRTQFLSSTLQGKSLDTKSSRGKVLDHSQEVDIRRQYSQRPEEEAPWLTQIKTYCEFNVNGVGISIQTCYNVINNIDEKNTHFSLAKSSVIIFEIQRLHMTSQPPCWCSNSK